MLSVRGRAGIAEQHERFADLFIVLDGRATLITGGTVSGAHIIAPGEIRGTAVEGGKRIELHPGDLAHVPAGVPHQTVSYTHLDVYKRQLLPCFFAGELPVDGYLVAVHFPVPGSGLLLQLSERRDSSSAQALTGEQTDLDLRLVQPAAVFGSVMHREALPQQAADLLTESVHQRFAVMGAQIVHDEVDGVGIWIAGHDLKQIVGELGSTTVGGRLGEMPSGLGFNTAKDVGRAAPLVLRIAPQNSSRPHGAWRANIGVQHHRLFIHTDHGLLVRERLLDVYKRQGLFLRCKHSPVHRKGTTMRKLTILLAMAAIALPALAVHRVSVDQFHSWLAARKASNESDNEIAKQISTLQLLERLSPSTLASLKTEFSPGPKTSQALDLLADCSAILDPPATELPSQPPPDAAALKAMFHSKIGRASCRERV